MRGVRDAASDRMQSQAREQEFARELRGELGERLQSVTHSQGVTVVLACEPGQSWGVDLEFADREVSPAAQARFWSDSEKKIAPELTALMVWTLKEAAVKARGIEPPSQPITQWRITARLPQSRTASALYELSNGELTVRGAVLPQAAHGIPQALVAVACLAKPSSSRA